MSAELRFDTKRSPLADPELELLARVQSGDERAMVTLFERHSKLIYSVAYRVLRDSAAAEDVLQEVFMQIWRTPTDYLGIKQNLGGWLAIVARNRAVDLIRKRRRTESVDDFSVSSPCNVFEDVQHVILLERVRSAIADLPQEQKIALEMAFFDGLSHTEIATKLGHPIGTVKTRIRSALRTLTKAFEI